MQRTVRRLALLTACGAMLSALAATPALAATSATTLPASSVTNTAATLEGTVSTGGVSTLWVFQYGRSENYSHETSTRVIPGGFGDVSVSARITGLKADTEYHFRLAVLYTSPGSYYSSVAYGHDVTFTTKKNGELKLLSHDLTVKNGSVSIPLKCASSQDCKGKLTIDTIVKIKHGFATVTCAKTDFKIDADKEKTLHPSVSGTCMGLLNGTKDHRYKTHLTAELTTGQPRVSEHVTLIRK